jgi:hypothetical protein
VTALLLSDEEFAAAMAAVVADPTNAATAGDASDVIAYDPAVLAAEGGGDDPDACADHVGDDAHAGRVLDVLGFAAAAGWRATWLADAFRAAGLVVVEVEGWKTRGVDFPDPPIEEGVSIFHHTASNRNSGPAGGLRIVTYGREGLAGPIANWLTARNGVIYVVAAGVANNAGQGNARAAGMPNVTGNSNTLADEMENDGIGEPYPAVQRTAAMRSHAVVHREMGWSAARGIGHLEWSTSGKIDPLVRTWGAMTDCRRSLAGYIAGSTTEDDMTPQELWTTPLDIQGVGRFAPINVLMELYLRSLPRGAAAAAIDDLHQVDADVDAIQLDVDAIRAWLEEAPPPGGVDIDYPVLARHLVDELLARVAPPAPQG